MIRIDQSKPFQALWNASNAGLNPTNDGIFWSLSRKIKNFIFYLPNSIIAACINPRSETQFEESLEPGSFTKEIITPDQIHLSAHIHFIQGATSNTPTVILFNPLGAGVLVHSSLQTALTARKCNVVMFNYRGLGSTWSAEDLVVDGDSVYQYVTLEFGTLNKKVHFYGFSLGGVIAAQAKALHPESEGKYVGDRPFKSVFSLITENCCIERCGWLIKKITSFMFSIFLAYPIYLLGWEWDGDKALAKLKGEKRIIYHPNDWLIPHKATLAFACQSNHAVVRLDPTKTGPSTHFDSIESHSTNNIGAIAVVADFLADAN